jgi:hypothetical protein
MADLQIIVSDSFHSAYSDGDVLVAKSELHSLAVAADGLCGVRDVGLNSDGYRSRGSLPHRFQELVSQYRVERIGPGRIRETNLYTNQEKVSDPGSGKVAEMLRKRLRWKDDDSPIERHTVFGEKGAEVFYHGRQRPWRRDAVLMAAVWDEIEASTPHRREDHQAFRFGVDDLKQFLVLSCDPLTPGEADALVQPLRDDAGEVVMPRRWWVDWRRVIRGVQGVTEADVLDPGTSLDVRPLQPRPLKPRDFEERTA